MTLQLQYSPDGHVLYLQFRDGDVAETAEVEPDVYVDLDPDARPLGVEFVDANAFFPFLGRVQAGNGETVELPRDLELNLERLVAEREAALGGTRGDE